MIPNNAENNWKKIGTEPDADFNALLSSTSLHKSGMGSPLKSIKKKLLLHLWLSISIGLFFATLFVLFSSWQLRLILALLTSYTFWLCASIFQLYNSIPVALLPGITLLNELQQQHLAIDNWIKVHIRSALYIYPFSAAGGFMLGGMLGAGKEVGELMTKPFFIITLILVSVVLVPVGHYITRWLFKRTFGTHMAQLEQNIADLQNPK